MREDKIINLIDGKKEKTFKVRQMSALKLEDWMNRAFFLFAKAGSVDKKDVLNILTSGDVGQIISLAGSIEYKDIRELYNELLDCVEYIPDKSNMNFGEQLTLGTVESIVEDVKTLYSLRIESLKVNFSFFGDGGQTAMQPQKQEEDESIIIRKPTRK